MTATDISSRTCLKIIVYCNLRTLTRKQGSFQIYSKPYDSSLQDLIFLFRGVDLPYKTIRIQELSTCYIGRNLDGVHACITQDLYLEMIC